MYNMELMRIDILGHTRSFVCQIQIAYGSIRCYSMACNILAAYITIRGAYIALCFDSIGGILSADCETNTKNFGNTATAGTRHRPAYPSRQQTVGFYVKCNACPTKVSTSYSHHLVYSLFHLTA